MKKKAKPQSWLKALTSQLSVETTPIECNVAQEATNGPVLREKAPVARRKRPAKSDTRKELERLYVDAWGLIPDVVSCAVCGRRGPKESFERHHPAGRRKASFCFTFQVCGVGCPQNCHEWIHADGNRAALLGLQWNGRNSKVFTEQDARKLVALCPNPPIYSLQIFSPDKS